MYKPAVGNCSIVEIARCCESARTTRVINGSFALIVREMTSFVDRIRHITIRQDLEFLLREAGAWSDYMTERLS